MSIRKLIGGALRPGASLKHEHHRLMAVDVLRALAFTTPVASALIHARSGKDNLPELAAAVKEIAVSVFSDRGWEIPEHRVISPDKRLDLFVEQCWREYMGEPCKRCRGHGFVGHNYKANLRHRLYQCQKCEGRGFEFIPFTRWSGFPTAETHHLHGVRRICSSCNGKRLVEVSEAVKVGKLKVCMACWGSGSVAASVRRRARALRYDKMHIYAVWQERFRIVLAGMRAAEREGLIVVRVGLFGT